MQSIASAASSSHRNASAPSSTAVPMSIEYTSGRSSPLSFFSDAPASFAFSIAAP